MDEVVRGALVSGSLIVAIGAQNAFVLKQGLLKNNIFWVVLICFLCDFALISLGVLGLGSIISSSSFLMVLLASLGGLFLMVYGARSIASAYNNENAMNIQKGQAKQSVTKTISLTLAITLLNPHVYLDTVVIIGSIAGTLVWEEKVQFLLGAVCASFIWFFSIGYGSRLLLPIFKNPKAWKIIDFCIGTFMLILAYGLFKTAWVNL